MIKSTIFKVYIAFIFAALCNLCFTTSNSSNEQDGVKYCQACHNVVGDGAISGIQNLVAHYPSYQGHKAELLNFSAANTEESAASKDINLVNLKNYISEL